MANVSGELQADWLGAVQLLQAGEYQQVADLLQKIQTQNGVDNPLLALLVASVQQICFACGQCRADQEWYQQASSAAQSREAILRRQAQSILTGISTQSPVEPTATAETPELTPAIPGGSSARPNRWAQVRDLFHQMRQLFGGEDESAAPPSAPPPLPVEQPESPATEPTMSTWPPPETENIEAALPVQPAPPPVAMPDAESHESVVPAPPPPAVEAAPNALVAAEVPVALPVTHDLAICCLGSFRVYQRDQLIEEWNGLKGQMILKYLAVQRGAPVAKDVLMEIFWPDSEPEAARRNLHQAIYSLRQTLRRRDPTRQHIHFENNQYLLNSELSVWVDSEEFAAQVQTGRRLEAAGETSGAMAAYGRAEGLYQGDFLAEDLYEEWPRGQRERLRSAYLEIADHLSEYYLQQREYTATSALCHKILGLDNCFEAAHQRLMRCYLAQGQRHLAIRQYHTCVQTLAAELDVPPDDETRRLYESITNGG